MHVQVIENYFEIFVGPGPGDIGTVRTAEGTIRDNSRLKPKVYVSDGILGVRSAPKSPEDVRLRFARHPQIKFTTGAIVINDGFRITYEIPECFSNIQNSESIDD